GPVAPPLRAMTRGTVGFEESRTLNGRNQLLFFGCFLILREGGERNQSADNKYAARDLFIHGESLASVRLDLLQVLRKVVDPNLPHILIPDTLCEDWSPQRHVRRAMRSNLSFTRDNLLHTLH